MEFSPFVLVPFAPEHEPGVIRVIEGCYRDYGQVIELDTLDGDLRRIDVEYPSPRSAFRVLLDGKTVVGTVAVRPAEAPGECELKRVFLQGDCRGRGLGKRLVQWAAAWARDAGYRTMHIWTDVLFETAHQLYRTLGAEDTGRRRYLGGANRVHELYFRLELAGRARRAQRPPDHWENI